MFFVLDYDELKGELLQLIPFDNIAGASQERMRLARENLDGRRTIFILIAESAEALPRTHGRYFRRRPERISHEELKQLAWSSRDALVDFSALTT